jgi:hypothetical protein
MPRTQSVALASTTNLTRYLGAIAVLAVGVDHIEQYYVDYYRAVPTIGTLFVLDFISATVIAAGLLLPLERLTSRFGDRLSPVLALAGIGIAAGTLVGLLASENVGLFGFMEIGYRSAIVLSIVFDVAAVAFLSAFLTLRALSHGTRRQSLTDHREIPQCSRA